MKKLFKAIVFVVVMLAMVVSMSLTANAYEYPDNGYWANEAIDAAINNGLLRGKEDGKIHSEDNLTRAEMAAIMVRAFGATIKADISKFNDLAPSAWYYDEFSKAVQMRVFEGDGSGSMRPNDYITREEVFTVVARAMVLKSSDHSSLSKFKDANNISNWAKDYMGIMTKKSYVNGDTDGNVNPKNNITRAEFAQLMHNIFRNYYSKADIYKEITNSRSTMINVGDVTFKDVTIDGDLVIGDGNAKGTIRLENVNIKGRLLVRGSQRVELVNTTVGEMVVVNNYNTVVHFDNYRDEKVFEGIVLNTEATFKEKAKPSGGGGGGGGDTTYYTITYNVDGGTSIQQGSITSGADLVLPAVGSTTKTGYTLKGWEVNGITYAPGATVSGISANTTVKALWELATYTITYNVDGGSAISSGTLTYGQTLTLPGADSTLKSGYKLTGWIVNGTEYAPGATVSNISADTTVKAVWTDVEFEVTFDTDGGSAIANGTAILGEDFVLPGNNSTNKDDYYLKGWIVNGTTYAPGATVSGITADTTIKALWEKITSDTKGSYIVMHYQQNTDLTTYTQISADDKTVNDVVVGSFTFTADENKYHGFKPNSNSVSITKDITENGTTIFEVYYDREAYTIIFDTNGGTPINNDTAYYGVGFKLPAVGTTTKTGYILTAWTEYGPTFDPGAVVYGITNNMTLIAVWEPETYTVTFDVVGGSAIASQTATYGQDFILPDANSTTKTGYILTSWIVNGITYAPCATVSGIVADITVKAVWKVETYEITFDVDGGLHLSNGSVEYGKDFILPDANATTKIGHTLTGWIVNGTTYAPGATVSGITADTTIKAVWEANVYTVTYDTKGGTPIPPATVKYGEQFTLPGADSTTKTGYKLRSWKIYGLNYLPGAITYTVITSDTVIEAVWERETYTVTYNTDGGTPIDAEKVNLGEGFMLPGNNSTSKDGYYLKGWLVNGTEYAPGTLISGITTDITVEAVWKEVTEETKFGKYTIRYYKQNTDLTTYEYIAEDDYVNDKAPVGLYGYQAAVNKYVGFEINPNYKQVTFTVVEGEMAIANVYYDRKSYSVTYYTEDGTSVDKGTAYYGVDFALPGANATTKTGHTLTGWEVNGTEYDPGATVTGIEFSTVATAIWERDTYTVTYNTDGGTPVANGTATYGIGFTLPGADATTKVGHIFKGWIVNGTEYKPGTTVSGIIANTTVKAVWEAETYTVTYNTVGGSAINPTTVNYGDNIVLPAVGSTTKTGYTLVGWMVKGTQYNPGATVSDITADTEVLAVWKLDEYKITYDTDGGTDIADAKAYYGVDFILPGVGSTAKTGHILTGWTINGTKYDLGATVSGIVADTTVKAVWERETYTVTYNTVGGSAINPTTVNYGDNLVLPTMGSTTKTGYVLTGWNINGTQYSLGATVSNITSNIIVMAVWEDETYEITFDVNGGSAIAPTTVKYGEELILPAVGSTTKLDYELEGWLVNGTKYNPGSTVSGIVADTTVKAVWKWAPAQMEYTIKYYVQNTELNGYEETSKTEYGTVGSTVTVTPEEKTGFDVNTTNSVLSGKLDRNNPLVIKVYYDREIYEITFDGNGYTGTILPVTVAYGQNVVSKLPTITRDGYVLDGWFDGTTKIDDNYVIKGNVELKAEWTPAEAFYIVEYYAQNTDLATYSKYDEKQFATKTDEIVYADTSRVIEGYTYNASYMENVLSGKVPATGTLVLKVYYVRKTFGYAVKVYQQNVDNLSLYDEISSTPKTAKYGQMVSVMPEDITGFDVNTSKSVLSGEVKDGSLILNVYYDREVYEITFDGNGYTGNIPSTTAVYGQNIVSKLPSIRRDGYVLDGWFDGTTKIDDNYVIKGNVELKAEWTPAEAFYIVEYYAQNTDLATYSKYDEKQFATKTGATVYADTTRLIDGYTYNASYSGNVLSGEVPATGTLVLKVYYDRLEYDYKVVYYTEKADAVGTYEESNREDKKGKFGTLVSVIPSPSVGFETNYGLSTLSGTVNKDGSLELKVYYDRKTYNYKVIHYTESLDQGYDEREEVYSAKFGTTVTVAPNDITGFVPDIYNSNFSGEVKHYDDESDMLVLEIYYDREAYTITFEAGQGLTNPSNIIVYYNVPVTLPTLTKTDYVFKGWEDQDGNKYVGSGAFTKATTLTGIWEYAPGQITYTVEYYVQNTDLATYEMTSQQFSGTVGSTVTVTPDEKTGFDVNEAKSKLSGTVDRENPLTLKVYYDREAYIVSFDAGEGVENPANVTVYYGVEVTLPVVGKDDYTFKGWSDGQNIYTDTAIFSANTQLTAEWEYAPGQIAYTIEYHTQNTDLTTYSMTLEVKNATSGTQVSVTPEEKEGFDVNETDSVLSGTASSGLVLKVYYDREAYTITFDAGEGVENPANITAYYGVEVALPTLTKDGVKFEGWSDGVNTVYGKVLFTKDTDLTALWTELVDYVTVTFYDIDNEVLAVDVEKNTTVEESQFPDYMKTYSDGYVKDSSVSSVYETPYQHTVNYGWWYNSASEKWEEFTTETVVKSDMDVYLKIKKFDTILTLASGEQFNFFAFYESDTRFADTIKDILYLGGPREALKISGYMDKVREKGIVQKVLDTDDNILMLSYMIKFATILGEDNVEKFIVDNAKEMFERGNNELLHDAFVEYIIAVANSDNPDEKKKVYDLMESTINHIFEEDEISTETLDIIRDLCDDVLSDPDTFKEVTGYELASLPSDTKTFVINYIIDQLVKNDDLFAEVVKEVTGVDYTDTTTTKDIIIAMAEKELTDNFDSTIDDIKGSYKTLIVNTVKSMLANSSNGLYDEVLSYAVTDEKATVISTIKTLLTSEDSLYDEVIGIIADDEGYRAMVAEVVGAELATNDTLFEVLTGYNPALVPDRAAAIDTLKGEITNNKSTFETAITDAENAGYKSFIIDSIVSKLETNDTFFNTVLEKAKVDYRATMVNTIVSKLEEPGSPMYDKVIELAKTDVYKQTIKDSIIAEMKGTNGDSLIAAIADCAVADLSKDPQDKDGVIIKKAKEKLDDNDYLNGLIEGVTGFENYTLPATPKDFITDMVIAELSNTDSSSATRDMIIEEAIAYLLETKDEDEIEHLADYAIDYLGNHPDERDALVDEIINDVYKDELDKLVYQLINDEQFDVTANTLFVAEGLKLVLLEKYTYEAIIGNNIPQRLEKAFEIYPEEKIKEIYNFAIDDLISQINEGIDIAKAGGTGKIDCGITPVVNIISDVYVPLHESMLKILEDKVSDKYYYSGNIYLQELVKLLDPQVWVSGSANAKPNDKTGYKIYDLDYYYDLFYKIYVLSDDAIMWYYENLVEPKYMEVTENYKELVLKYVNVFADMVNDYADEGTVPDVHDKVNDKLVAFEKALKEKYPELINGLIDKFKNSQFYNREVSEVDYHKVRDKVYNVFNRALHLKTDEYFDIILNQEAYEDLENKVEDKIEDKLNGRLDGEYYSKIDDDTYMFEVNDYMIRFIRELRNTLY